MVTGYELHEQVIGRTKHTQWTRNFKSIFAKYICTLKINWRFTYMHLYLTYALIQISINTENDRKKLRLFYFNYFFIYLFWLNTLQFSGKQKPKTSSRLRGSFAPSFLMTPFKYKKRIEIWLYIYLYMYVFVYMYIYI